MTGIVPIPSAAIGIPAGAFARLGITEKLSLLQPPKVLRTWNRKPIVVRAPGDGQDKYKINWSASGPGIGRMPAMNGVIVGATTCTLWLQGFTDAWIPVGETSVYLVRPPVPGAQIIATTYGTGRRVPINFDGDRTVSLPAGPSGDVIMVSYRPVVQAILVDWTAAAQFDATMPWSQDWEEV